MAQVDRIDGVGALTAVTGVLVPYEAGRGCLLAANTTYYFPFSMKDGGISSAQLQWDSGIVLTNVWFEDTNLPAYIGQGNDVADVSDFSAAKGAWIQETPSTAYVSVTSSDGTTGGATATNGAIATTGGTAGGAVWNLSGVGSRRGRMHVQVGATGGVLRVHMHGKS
jgi:hypothetical protein